MAPRLAYKTVNSEGQTCYWYRKRKPYKRPQRPSAELQQLLGLLFPLPPAPSEGWRRACEDEEEFERLQATEMLRNQLKARVYKACASAPSGRPEDDPCDPIIDYEYLKSKLTLVNLHQRSGGRGTAGDYAWEHLPPFTWAAEDVLHAQLAQQDIHMQHFMAQGGDGEPEIYLGWVDSDEGIEGA